MKLYFAYGANLNISNMRYRCPDAVAVESFDLAGWSLAFSGVATIRPDPVGVVSGALWAISDEDEQALDTFEGWPTLYRKEILTCDGLEFMVYVMNSDRAWLPSSGYFMSIAQGYRDWGLDFARLEAALAKTQQEIDHDDLYSRTYTGSGRFLGPLENGLYLESGHDLRWLRDDRDTYLDTSTVE